MWSGGVGCYNENITLINCSFINNHANTNGGAVEFTRRYGTILECIFTNNTATAGGAIKFHRGGLISNCSFINSKLQSRNGIHTQNLTINGGNGIVYVFVNGTISGITLIALNNQTYYCPPNENINLTNKMDGS